MDLCKCRSFLLKGRCQVLKKLSAVKPRTATQTARAKESVIFDLFSKFDLFLFRMAWTDINHIQTAE